MNLVLIATFFVLITTTTSHSFRIKRQNDMIFFPTSDEDFPSSFSRPIPPSNGRPFGNQMLSAGPRQQQQQQQQAAMSPAAQPDAPARRPKPSPDFLRCMKQCPTTTEYNPVCGSDQVQYHNEQRLNCANFCGASVRFIRRGNCSGVLATNTIRF